jgi:hypothetical protein
MPVQYIASMMWSTDAPAVTTWHGPGTLATVSADGAVAIDWPAVEATAEDPASDKITWGVAKLLLAARDGTAKPLEAQ